MPEQGLLAVESEAIEVPELLKLVFKTFWSATYICIPPILLREDQFSGWMAGLLCFMQRPVPTV